MGTTYKLGDVVEYDWDALDRVRTVVGVVESYDLGGLTLRLAVPTPFAEGQEPRDGLWVPGRRFRHMRKVHDVELGEGDVGGLPRATLTYLSSEALERSMAVAREVAS